METAITVVSDISKDTIVYKRMYKVIGASNYFIRPGLIKGIIDVFYISLKKSGALPSVHPHWNLVSFSVNRYF